MRQKCTKTLNDSSTKRIQKQTMGYKNCVGISGREEGLTIEPIIVDLNRLHTTYNSKSLVFS